MFPVKKALSKMSFYQQDTVSLYSWFLLVLSFNIFLMTFQGSIFLNIKLGPTTTSSQRRRGRGLHNPDSSHDQIRCFWLAEVRNFTNIMIEYDIKRCRNESGRNVRNDTAFPASMLRKKQNKCTSFSPNYCALHNGRDQLNYEMHK